MSCITGSASADQEGLVSVSPAGDQVDTTRTDAEDEGRDLSFGWLSLARQRFTQAEIFSDYVYLLDVMFPMEASHEISSVPDVIILIDSPGVKGTVALWYLQEESGPTELHAAYLAWDYQAHDRSLYWNEEVEHRIDAVWQNAKTLDGTAWRRLVDATVAESAGWNHANCGSSSTSPWTIMVLDNAVTCRRVSICSLRDLQVSSDREMGAIFEALDLVGLRINEDERTLEVESP